MDKKAPLKVKCPHCGKETEYSLSNSSRPFCSARCKLIDLGQWASEEYKIPVKEIDDSEMVDLEFHYSDTDDQH